MAKIDEIHGDVKVLKAQLDTLTDIIKPVSDLARVVAVHQEKWDNLEENIVPPLQEDVKSLNRWKWGQIGSGFSFSALLTYIHHLMLKG